MGLYKHLRKTWQDNANKDVKRQRILQWRQEPVTIRVKRPTRLDRARSLGYKAKQGIIVVRQRVGRGGRMRPDIKGGRSSRKQRQKKIVFKNYQQIAEEKAVKKFTNCEVLNSYFVGKDGHNIWYEIILLDRFHPQVLSSKQLSGVASQKGRASRGLTSAGRKARGLRNKGKGTEQLRPSRAAAFRRKNNKNN